MIIRSETMALDEIRKKRLESVGFKVGEVADFLDLSPEETAIIEIKLALTQAMRHRSISQKLSQFTIAKRIHSSASRVKKLEAGDPSIPVDMLIRVLLATGATREEVGKIISSGSGNEASRKTKIPVSI